MMSFARPSAIAASALALAVSATPTLAQDQAQTPQQQVYVGDTFGDWTMRCITNENGNDPCELVQELFNDSGTRVAEVVLVNLPIGSQAVAGLAVTTPLETMLQAGVTLQVDENEQKRYPFRYCSARGCHANVGLTLGDIAEYKAGATALMTIFPFRTPDQAYNLNISLKGFTAGYTAVLEQNTAN